ncbi:choice-of-anchor I family protein [Flavobacterium sp. MFBS3-15]|uniref:choice-of-anchor I family protein n=1 Tax=Flavobacterium sp. MFBS3-15 TaxID=2989816 RepID=UPI00223634F3|nr:choice-of-anchor I family protein [Flavobacterium sp. MFBS3-15]MCW4469942.1 choice-of-anchor I family protein [Flavobacterium sp. MFBS3-15]
MLNNYAKKGLLLLGFSLATQFAEAQELLHYWHFNTLAAGTVTAPVAADDSEIAGTTSITYPGTGAGYLDDVTGDILNATDGIVAGKGLRPRNPSNTRELLIAFPTTGYEDIVMKFATTRTTQGASEQLYSYSIDGGANFITTGLPVTTFSPTVDIYGLVTLDFSSISGAANNPNFIVKINFGGTTAAGTSGNNRFDNITIEGNEIAVPQLLHYWHFNTLPTGTITAALSTDFSIVAGTKSITYPGTGAGYLDDVAGDALNAQGPEGAGKGLRPRNPSNTRELLIAFPTTGYEDIVMNFATTRTTQGASEQSYSYSTDGGTTFITTWLPVTTFSPTVDTYGLVTLDFSSIAGANNNPNFIVKINFGGTTAAGTSGNNRFDNITVNGVAMEGTQDTTAPTVAITPINNAVYTAISVQPTIAFNEAVRLIDDSAITNINVDALVELRLNNATGAVVPFDATITGNTITIAPVAALLNNQQYYVALLPNVVEDMSGNAVTAAQASTFTTIALQSSIGAGDMVFVGYRMNNTDADDQVALLTLVDIAPGTFINLTDSKYTTNAQPQCPNGIVWTATTCVPAGSVITIQTEALGTNTGIATGSGFGLSSGGDQVMVYTGTAAAPNYITALSSNGWVTANTSCSGSSSMIPATLTDGTNALNTSTSPGNNAGNTVNAYYSGTQAGSPAELRTAILNPANWTGAGGSTPAQTWPTWAFPSSPTVQSATVVNNTTIELVFNNELDAASAATAANYTGIAGLATASANGNMVTLTYTTPFAAGTDYVLTVNNLEDESGLTMACAYTFSFDYNTAIAFATDFIVVNENTGSLDFVLNLTSPSAGTVDLVVKAAPFSTATAGEDFTLATQTLTFTGSSALTQTINIPIIDDTNEEQQAEYFVLSLENAVGLTIEGQTLATIYIKDNDRLAPVPNQDIQLDYITSFDPSGASDSTCEIVAYDPASKRLFATSAVEGRLDIVDFQNPQAPVTINSIDMNTYGGVTSVAVKNGIVAVASPNAQEHLDGKVVFFDTDGDYLNQVTVGALPDNISFTPDGSKVLTANEGQPNSDYSIDPEGSVSIIDISGGIPALTQADATTLLFTAYNSQETTLISSGVRKLKLTSTMSQDFEPEYITTAANSEKAWVTLQENNAIAEIDLTNNTIADVWALGTKDMSEPGNGFDISDNNNEVLIANWPIQSYFIPDAVATYNVNGTNYIITANEGDEKEYTGFEERTTIGASSYLLDAANYPQAAMLKKNHNAGRMRVTNLNGNTDGDAEFEQIYSVGTRSFSIFNADTKEIAYDSADDFEMYTASALPAIFNADSESNTPKSRSRAKGPEPEGVTIAAIMDRTFAFIGLERIGGVMVYDVTDPANVQFVDYNNSRSTSAYTGDHGPEGITYISAADSPDSKPYIIVANEISGTLSIFEINMENLGAGEFGNSQKAFVVFPNPVEDGIAYFNRAADIEVYDYSGKLILKEKQALKIDTSNLASGLYLVKTSEGITKKLLVK